MKVSELIKELQKYHPDAVVQLPVSLSGQRALAYSDLKTLYEKANDSGIVRLV